LLKDMERLFEQQGWLEKAVSIGWKQTLEIYFS
jgi:hypothetical protein